MPGCAVAKCNNYTKLTRGSDVKYFRFPKDKELCRRWIVACGRGDEVNLKNAYICSAHFECDCFAEPSLKEKLLNYTSKTKRGLKRYAVPTVNIPVEKNKVDSDRSSCMIKRRKINETFTVSNDIMDIDKKCTKGDSEAEGKIEKS